MAQVQGQWTMPLSVTDMIAMIAQLPIAAKHQIRDFLDEELESEEDSLDSLAEIKQVYEEYESGDYITFDLRFHQGLLAASHNRMLVQMSKALSALLRTSFELSTAKKDGPLSSLPLHRAVLDAVIAQNPTQAERAIGMLIDSAHTDIEEILTSRRRLPRVNKPASELRAA